jgi:hypothetical protein
MGLERGESNQSSVIQTGVTKMNVPSSSEVARYSHGIRLVQEWKKKYRGARRTREEKRATLFSVQNQSDVAKWMEFIPTKMTRWFQSPIIHGDSE